MKYIHSILLSYTGHHCKMKRGIPGVPNSKGRHLLPANAGDIRDLGSIPVLGGSPA